MEVPNPKSYLESISLEDRETIELIIVEASAYGIQNELILEAEDYIALGFKPLDSFEVVYYRMIEFFKKKVNIDLIKLDLDEVSGYILIDIADKVKMRRATHYALIPIIPGEEGWEQVCYYYKKE